MLLTSHQVLGNLASAASGRSLNLPLTKLETRKTSEKHNQAAPQTNQIVGPVHRPNVRPSLPPAPGSIESLNPSQSGMKLDRSINGCRSACTPRPDLSYRMGEGGRCGAVLRCGRGLAGRVVGCSLSRQTGFGVVLNPPCRTPAFLSGSLTSAGIDVDPTQRASY